MDSFFMDGMDNLPDNKWLMADGFGLWMPTHPRRFLGISKLNTLFSSKIRNFKNIIMFI